MRTPIYKSRPVAPIPASPGGERINDFIIMSEGMSNTYLLETSEGGVLINAGLQHEAPIHYENYRNLSAAVDDLKYLITTQGHVDHVSGIEFFREKMPKLEYVAQARTLEQQAYEARLSRYRRKRSMFRFGESIKSIMRSIQGSDAKPRAQSTLVTPDSTFEDRYELTLGDLQIVLIAAKGAETNDSLVVWLPQHEICLTGNLFGCPFGHFPNLVTLRGDRYRDALTCAASAQTVLDLEPAMILYGHHAPIVGKQVIREELTAYRDAVLHVHDEVVKGMNEGKSLHTLMQEISLPAECDVGEGYGKINWSVRAIWENYSGWFKHESTTELFSVPQSEVFGDLVSLVGAEALLELARKKAADGRLEEAVHLLDILFGADPDHPGAIDLAIAVHEKMLVGVENYWLSGWLEHQIRELRGRSAKQSA